MARLAGGGSPRSSRLLVALEAEERREETVGADEEAETFEALAADRPEVAGRVGWEHPAHLGHPEADARVLCHVLEGAPLAGAVEVDAPRPLVVPERRRVKEGLIPGGRGCEAEAAALEQGFDVIRVAHRPVGAAEACRRCVGHRGLADSKTTSRVQPGARFRAAG